MRVANYHGGRHYTGIFLWKPVAEHFPYALVVGPQRYVEYATTATLYAIRTDGKLIRVERMRLKSRGLGCVGSECLGADTWLASRRGAWFRKRFPDGLIVRFTARRVGCVQYKMRRPNKRAVVL